MTENITITAEAVEKAIEHIKHLNKKAEQYKIRGDERMFNNYRCEAFGFERALDILDINYDAAYEN